MIEQFHWLRPLWLLAIAPALLLTVFLWRARSSGANWRRAIAPELLDHLLDHRGERRVRWPWWLVCAGWVLGCLALAGPTWEKLPQPVLQKRDALVVVLDLSLSMTAADVQPSRLQRARYKLLDLLQRRQEGLTGLVAYAGDAHVVTPLTDDTATIANLVPALAPDMMPIYGSDVGGGIGQALQLLHSSGIARGRILLVTDGIETADIAGVGDAVGKTAHTLSILGVGTAQGAPIPIQGGFFKNSDGSIAIPQLHRDRLLRLAAKTGGIYRDLSVDDSDLDQLLPDAAQPDAALRTTERQFDQWRERGPWLVVALLPLAAFAFRRGWLLLLLGAVLIAPADSRAADAPAADSNAPAWAQRGAQLWRDLWSTPDQQAARKLQDGDARAAADQFSDPAWRAAAQYRAGDYEQAAQTYQTLLGPDGQPSADADYNRGNALAHAGHLEEAIQAFDEALKKNPAMEDAKNNRKQVEDLLQQQQQIQPDKQSSDRDSQQQSSQQGSSQQDSSHQSSSQQGSSQSPQDSSQRSQQRENDNAQQQNDPAAQQAHDRSPQDERQAQPDAERQAADAAKKQQAAQPRQNTAGDEPDSQADDKQPIAADQHPATPEQQRQQQVMEQWLRQIPDEPEGLLRRKFDYEHRQRAPQREPADDRPLY